MSDLKEFLLKKHFTCLEEMSEPIEYLDCKDNAVYLDDLGLFFLDKRNHFLGIAEKAKFGTSLRNKNMALAKEYEKNCVACLGKDKVKELIKELGDSK